MQREFELTDNPPPDPHLEINIVVEKAFQRHITLKRRGIIAQISLVARIKGDIQQGDEWRGETRSHVQNSKRFQVMDQSQVDTIASRKLNLLKDGDSIDSSGGISSNGYSDAKINPSSKAGNPILCK